MNHNFAYGAEDGIGSTAVSPAIKYRHKATDEDGNPDETAVLQALWDIDPELFQYLPKDVVHEDDDLAKYAKDQDVRETSEAYKYILGRIRQLGVDGKASG